MLVNDTGAELDGSGGGDAAERVAEEIRNAGGDAIADDTSVASFEGANAIVRRAVEHYGRLDVLVNNAGILRDRTLLKMNPEEWQAVLDVHLTGTFACLQAAARQMKDQGDGGRIINTSSSSGFHPPSFPLVQAITDGWWASRRSASSTSGAPTSES